jgi:hypothetical protein
MTIALNSGENQFVCFSVTSLLRDLHLPSTVVAIILIWIKKQSIYKTIGEKPSKRLLN